MMRTIPQLEKQCAMLGLVLPPEKCTGRGGKPAKRDYIRLLGEWFIKHKYGGITTAAMRWRRSINSPMLAAQFKSASKEQQAAIFDEDAESPWSMEKKHDGVRALVIYDHITKEVSVFSRNISVEDYLPINYAEKILNLENVSLTTESSERVFFSAGRQIEENISVFDGEVYCTSPGVQQTLNKRNIICLTQLDATNAILQLNTEESKEVQREHPLAFVFWDMPVFNSHSLMEHPLRYRREKLREMFSATNMCNHRLFMLSDVITSRKREFVNKLLQGGGEGAIAKHQDGIYVAEDVRHPDKCIKVKRDVMTGTDGETQTEDGIAAWISGFTPGKTGTAFEGLVGSIQFSVTVVAKNGMEREHVLANISGITDEMRRDISIVQDGVVGISPKYLNMVADITGQDVSAKSLALSHARIIRLRPDRDKFSCILFESDLSAQVL
jgi:ATP-dependent DNA ligase